jgi:spore maturation protein CgeB
VDEMGKLEGIDRISEFSKKFSAISTYLGYKKFQDDLPRVLAFDSEGWCNPDILAAINKLGYPLQTIKVRHLDPTNKNLTLEDYLKFHRVLIKSLIEFKPDCILTMNHAAFDSLGLLTKILDQFAIPFISWFVDSPLYIFRNPNSQLSNNLYLFCWEKTFIKRLNDIGFENLFYLPLATNPEVFLNPKINEADEKFFGCDVAFVGNSNKEGVKKYEFKEFLTPLFSNLAAQSIEIQLEDPSRGMDNILKEIDINRITDKFDVETRFAFESYCVLKATSKLRNSVIKTLSKEFNFKLFGDSDWKEEFLDNYIKRIDYYKELPIVYKSAKIVVNLTSFQMNTAINQRIFDAPLAGGFIISDYRSDFDELFGKGMIPTFENEVEMINLIKYYLENDHERILKIDQLKQIILEKHTYENRVKEMFSIVKNRFIGRK